MTYVLLYVNQDQKPCYIQGTVEQINNKLRTLWLNGDIDPDDWEFHGSWEMLRIENDELTPIEHVEVTNVPQFDVP